MKQVMQLHVIRSKTPQSCESGLLAWLVAWALQEAEAQEARRILQQVHLHLERLSSGSEFPPGELSPWLLTEICVQTFRQAVQGYWTKARLNLCLPHLQRFLYGCPRQRRLQSHHVCALFDQLAPASLARSGP